MKKLGKKNVENTKTVEAFGNRYTCAHGSIYCNCVAISASSGPSYAEYKNAYARS